MLYERLSNRPESQCGAGCVLCLRQPRVVQLDDASHVLGNPLNYTDPSGHGVDCGMGDSNCQNGMYVLPAPQPDSNDPDVQDAYLTYQALAYQLGRYPTVQDVLRLTIASEFWVGIDKAKIPADCARSIKDVGEEGVAREYYKACGGSSCQSGDPKLYHFMAGYQLWIGRPSQPDTDQEQRASQLRANLDNTVGKPAEVLKQDVRNNIVGPVAAQRGWTGGYDPNASWSLWGPTSASPDGHSFGTSPSDFAILAVDLGNGTYDYFTTGAQTPNFGGR